MTVALAIGLGVGFSKSLEKTIGDVVDNAGFVVQDSIDAINDVIEDGSNIFSNIGAGIGAAVDTVVSTQ